MLSLKAIIFISMLLSIAAIFSQTFSNTNTQLEQSLKSVQATLFAKNCAQIINSFYSNSGGQLNSFTANCTIKGENETASEIGGIEKKYFVLNKNSKTIHEKNSLKIEVKTDGHYEK